MFTKKQCELIFSLQDGKSYEYIRANFGMRTIRPLLKKSVIALFPTTKRIILINSHNFGMNENLTKAVRMIIDGGKMVSWNAKENEKKYSVTLNSDTVVLHWLQIRLLQDLIETKFIDNFKNRLT